MLAPILSLVAVLLFPVPTVADGCPDVTIVGVAGSGQSGFGTQVEGVVDAIAASATAEGLFVESEALDYPAISVSDSLGLVLFTGEYAESVESGVSELRRLLSALAADCPSTEPVIVGYSQGAEVIKRAFVGDPAPSGSGSIVLLADPTRDPDQAGVLRLGDPAAERPGAFGAVSIPSAIRPLVIDVCAPGDGVCERGRVDFAAHTDGYEEAPSEVAPIVVARLLSRPTPALRPR